MANSISDKQIIATLLTSKTITEAANTLGLSTKTIYNKLGNQSFQNAYEAASDEVLREAVNTMRKALVDAVKTVHAIMQDEDNSAGVRLAAAKTILCNANTIIKDFQSRERATSFGMTLYGTDGV